MASTGRANSNHGRRTASWFKTSLCRRALTVRALEVKGKTLLVHSSKCTYLQGPAMRTPDQILHTWRILPPGPCCVVQWVS
ncbi:hypothetical protein CGCF415_v002966 [Colletotrichum fructicola]|nr:hypothetical protein CGCF415_v002966 [Colletotrichum fructicola]